MLYPFYAAFVEREHGWLLLFSALFGLTALGSPGFIPDLIGDIVAEASVARLIAGLPEIAVQMLLFSWLLVRWERRSYRDAADEAIA
ncbi:MAG: hypothetical protein KO206_02675 [Methanomicrobiaceae archaeon]|uniref:Uncharacterized protein n=1 Tax=hydrocarbon metagenome TaxID=938273 RepID=A0A0W8FHN6_9ZZZZ|nr:hypothetical protein [Methanomicrobiaceae archaeon]MDD5419628.1 hypothetical protein [Methanomicrobiaceae archaeon]